MGNVESTNQSISLSLIRANESFHCVSLDRKEFNCLLQTAINRRTIAHLNNFKVSVALTITDCDWNDKFASLEPWLRPEKQLWRLSGWNRRNIIFGMSAGCTES